MQTLNEFSFLTTNLPLRTLLNKDRHKFSLQRSRRTFHTTDHHCLDHQNCPNHLHCNERSHMQVTCRNFNISEMMFCFLSMAHKHALNPQTLLWVETLDYAQYCREFVQNYTPCLKKNCANLFFAPCLSNMNRFQYKLEGLSRKKPLTKLYLNCPLHLKYVLALPWKIWSVRLSRQRNN